MAGQGGCSRRNLRGRMTPTDTGIPDITFIDLTSYAGLVATGLLTFNLLLGLLLSTRYNPVARWPHRRLPLFDLHNWTGYVALAVVLLHPVLLLPSATAKFGWLDIVLPFWAPDQPIINTRLCPYHGIERLGPDPEGWF